jgi:hypothetical protein
MEKKNTAIISILFLILLFVVVMGIGLSTPDELLAETVHNYGTTVNDVSRPDSVCVFSGSRACWAII